MKLEDLSCSIFQEDYEGDEDGDGRSWTTRMIDFCKSCIDPTRPMGEDASSEGYATPRSLETPVQMASKCPSLNQIRQDPLREQVFSVKGSKIKGLTKKK